MQMGELDRIRKEKAMALQRQMQQAQQQAQQQLNQQFEEQAVLEQQITALEAFAKQHMSAEAIERYGNIKAAHGEKAVQALVVIGQLIKSGRVRQIDDAQLKEILTAITPKKREFQIKKI